jgi:Zn-dependent peptidase ImmA (M78 family)
MANSVAVKPELIDWAIDRCRLSFRELARKFPKLDEWRRGVAQPTFRELENFANRTFTPLGFLLLESPPEEKLPIPDFRTAGDTAIDRPSPNLIEMIQVMQRRQAWMRDYLIDQGEEGLSFVASAKITDDVISLASRIRDTLGLSVDWANSCLTWEAAVRKMRQSAEDIGILVSTSSVVGLNNYRPLDPEEFRGFVLCDSYAPLIFVNGADSKSAQMFTMAHELTHLWVGREGLFNLIRMMPHDNPTERFCNHVAAEFLIPGDNLSTRWNEANETEQPFHAIARWFKVSPVVAARRALDLGLINRRTFFTFYEQDQQDWQRRKAEEKRKKKGGPSFYAVQDIRLGRRFALAVIRATQEGRLLYRQAYQLTDLKGTTFDRYASHLRRKHQGWVA